MARVRYASSADAQGDSRDALAAMEQQGLEVLNLYRALANTPVLRNFLRLGSSLLRHGALDPTLREITILRVAQVTNASYEWAHHVPIAREAGVPDEQIDSLADWQTSPAFDARQRAALRYAEAVATVSVTDDVFDDARQHLGEPEIVELTLVVGFWGMVARALTALQVDIEPEFRQFAPA
ncbi:MAG: carboxymuconolactone decarboxylase family protein [Dehalococcoidia bacterium]